MEDTDWDELQTSGLDPEREDQNCGSHNYVGHT